MAKMFYTLEEAADKLGVPADHIKKMADEGKLQQFRDRDKLMFKREQVDEIFAMSRTVKIDGGEDEIRLSGDDPKKSETDTIDLISETSVEQPKDTQSLKSATATGISVFDADEVSAADPMAQTQITSSFVTDDEELSLESVGSGSGLLDLTRESDDTSLGAVELLEDIVPGGVDSDAKMGGGSGLQTLPGSSTGIFEGAGGAESAPSGLADLDTAPAYDAGAVGWVVEEDDPVGDGFGGGMLLGVFGVLVVVAIVAMTGVQGLIVDLTNALAEGNKDMTTGLMYYGGMAVACIIFALVGLFLGKARARG
ncbi:MAG: helix-turn-helix domain-containing protein [Planctomycetes bacterium]|nr:helix-turn-helix domain-containing protein [Planctomycetota bacterium]